MEIDHLDFDQCYRAVASRDARFDGSFIVAVRTTGIYCRPSCPTPVTPKPHNVCFYRSTAAAQLAGYRACKRCRPDAIPGSPEWDTRADLAGRAMRLIADGAVDRVGVAGLARHLAVSERHLHRSLVAAVGAPPLALARAQRAQTARILIETTDLPFSEIAFAAGFPSIRQFNDTIRSVFDATPTRLRGATRHGERRQPRTITVRLALRPPYDSAAMLGWLGARAVPGIEEADRSRYRRVLSLPGGPGTVTLEPAPGHIAATFALATMADLAAAVARCRRLLDLDADPAAVADVLGADDALGPLVRARPGLRAPGSVDGAEWAMRVVAGQHVSLSAGRAVSGKLVAAYGKPLDRPDGRLTHAYPAPETLAGADLLGFGLTRARADTLRELARRLADGSLVLDPGADRMAARDALRSIPGVGPWTAELVALRALGDPDAFPAGDLGLRAAATKLGLGSAATLKGRSERWRPWRGYAAHHLWEVNA